jgi:hypothetical protein
VESSEVRWRLQCDGCEVSGAIGGPAGARAGWCEACQRAESAPPERCARCGGALSLDTPRFVEAWGELQHLDAVLAAWRADPGPLAALLPERPRFLTDLDPPPVAAGDDSETRAALASLAEGAYSRALPALIAAGLRRPSDARLWQARAIAEERLGTPGAAESSWTRAIEAQATPGGGDSTGTRAGGASVAEGSRNSAYLARGVLRARRGELALARADFERTGESRESRWNRAAVIVLEAVATTPGLPAAEAIRAARDLAGPASEYWSDHTVGRLLWSLLVERALSRARRGAPGCPDERVLRAAELELEHNTFWDRALVLHGYAALGMVADAAAVASALAGEQAEVFALQPFLRARGAAALFAAAGEVTRAIAAGDPSAARGAIAPLLERADLRSYGVPCDHCGRGTLRAVLIEDEEALPDGE